MFITALLPATRDRLATVGEHAPLVEVAREIARSRINLVPLGLVGNVRPGWGPRRTLAQRA